MAETENEEALFDPEFLSRLRVLFFKLRKRRQLRRKAATQTPQPGSSREFRDYRQYTRGDDYRSIDWRLYARLQKLFIRVYEEVREYHIHILIDRSASLVEPHPQKRVHALRLAVALAYLGLISQHRVSILGLADQVHHEVRPVKGQGHIHEILNRLGSLEFGGPSRLNELFSQYRPSRDRQGMIFILSDFITDELEAMPATVKKMASWPAETHLIHLFHPNEREPDLNGEIKLHDVESTETRRLFFGKRERSDYTKRYDAYYESIQQAAMAHQVDYLPWSTEHNFEDLFIQLLSRGSALAGS